MTVNTVLKRLVKSAWLLGLLSLASVVVLWVLSSFLINEIFENDLYSKPFLITYFNTSIFIFYLVPLALKVAKQKYYHQRVNLTEIIRNEINNNTASNHHASRKEPHSIEDVDLENQTEHTGLTNNNDSDYSSTELDIEANNHHTGSSSQQQVLPKLLQPVGQEENLSLEETIKLSFQFCILWYLANLATNASLKYTSVSSQTILSTTSSFFTLFFGFLFGIDSINRLKVISLVLSFVGIVIITKIDSDSVPNKLGLKDDHYSFAVFFGNLLALLGASFYGAYTVLLKLKVKSEERLNAKLFFGFVGIFNLVLLWPTLFIWDYLGIEKFELPPSGFVWKIILINCLITFISDYCWAIAVLLTSPLTVTVGLSFTIPLALVGDALFKDKTMALGYLVGAIVIGISFLLINKDEEEEAISEERSE